MNLKRGEISLAVLGALTLASGFIAHKGIQNFFGSGTSTFLKQLITHPTEVGAFTPCSTYTAKKIVEPIKKSTKKNLRILEIGPGTGVITEQIVKVMPADATLDLVEINADFCELLREQYKTNQNISIYEMSILDWLPAEHYDIVISALPLNAFDQSFVEQVLEKFKSLVAPGGSFSYVELRGIMPVKKFFLSQKKQKDEQQKLQLIKGFKNEYFDESVTVFRNVPPIYVHRLKM